MAEFVVGTVLAVLPLVLKGFSEYAELATKFKTFTRYSSELRELNRVMSTQSWLVQDFAVQLLESICGDSKKARGLLSGREHILLDGLHIGEARVAQLLDMQDGFDLWNAALLQINSAIDAICQRLKNLHPAQGAPGIEDDIKQFKRKLKLSFTKTALKLMIQDLRESVSEFRDLGNQIRMRLESIPRRKSQDFSAKKTPKADPRSLQTYHRIRAASSKLYDIIAMRCSCDTPHRHLVSIGLLDKDALEKNLQKAVFSVAISSFQHKSEAERPIILEVELVELQAQEQAKTSVEGAPAPAGRRQSVLLDVFFGGSSAIPSTRRAVPDQAVPTVAEALLFGPRGFRLNTPGNAGVSSVPRSIMITQDLCQQLRAMVESDQTPRMYIRGPDKHGFEMRPHKRGPSGTHRSLADIIGSMSQYNETRVIPRATLANLAGSLAHAVLQYHSTPWLPGTWKSHDVAFFDSSEQPDVSETKFLSSPYLMTEFFGSSPAEELHENPDFSASRSLQRRESLSAGTARNEMLFHLGVVLLELGFSKPWPDLRRRALAKLPPEQHSNNRVAEKLAQENELRDRMGLNYCRIVRKCLACDFGLGEDNFGDAELQGAFLVDVVMALEKAERGLRDLDT
ncbi:hypothetical protein CONLIGDRAFT_715781 [Coniochaeta ligniaria NRRL 30616]|uniref:DUF7580 domain-containing protein n=1 Tax=Coniochaeta ligniaria NRRL 30616 TaxID=1408157 RepID=A0A1J7IHR2_9PEZI|nr:hypothetical protein CONLIGDRAFT_715781 [Coniochaeta ligniaria NRRL 30616]